MSVGVKLSPVVVGFAVLAVVTVVEVVMGIPVLFAMNDGLI